MTKDYYAHSLPGRPHEEWQRRGKDSSSSLNVSFSVDGLNCLNGLIGLNSYTMAKGFADDFGAGEWGHLAGLWHDLGKGDKWIFMLTETRIRS